MTEQQTELFEQNQYLATAYMRMHGKSRVYQIYWDDLHNTALFGLFQAAQKWDRALGLFKSFAFKCIHSSVVDRIRILCHCRPGLEKRDRSANPTGRGKGLRGPRRIPSDKIVHLDQIKVPKDEEAYQFEDTKTPAPDHMVEVQEVVAFLLPWLSPRERVIMEMLSQGYQQSEVAERLGVSRPVISNTYAASKKYLLDVYHTKWG